MEEKKKRWRPSLTAYRALQSENNDLQVENRALKSSNGYVEKELNRLRCRIIDLEKDNEVLNFEISQLRKRDLWERIWNR